MDLLHGVFESCRVGQPAYVFGYEAQGEFETSACEAEGLQGCALGGEAGLLDGAWGWSEGRVEDLLAVVL